MHAALCAQVPSVGFTDAFAAPFVAWTGRRKGKPYFFRKVRKQTAGRWSWDGDEAAPPAQIAMMWFMILSLFGFDSAACRAIRLTPYATRHLLPDCTRQVGWPLERRMELGRWSVSIIRELILLLAGPGAGAKRPRANAAGACANIYSRGNAATGREATLRREAVLIVRAHIGTAAWRDRVPVQSDRPSFSFLTDEAALAPVGSVDVVDEDVSDDSDGDAVA